jgi:hypothetical protein
MLEINLNNVEKLLFYNRKAQTLLPEHTHLFDQWRLSRFLPAMRPVSKRAVLQLLQSITDDQLARLSKHFGMPVTLDTVENKLVKNLEFSLDDAELGMNETDMFPFMSISRDRNNVYISNWR